MEIVGREMTISITEETLRKAIAEHFRSQGHTNLAAEIESSDCEYDWQDGNKFSITFEMSPL
jgi:hypothetical protein